MHTKRVSLRKGEKIAMYQQPEKREGKRKVGMNEREGEGGREGGKVKIGDKGEKKGCREKKKGGQMEGGNFILKMRRRRNRLRREK